MDEAKSKEKCELCVPDNGRELSQQAIDSMKQASCEKCQLISAAVDAILHHPSYPSQLQRERGDSQKYACVKLGAGAMVYMYLHWHRRFLAFQIFRPSTGDSDTEHDLSYTPWDVGSDMDVRWTQQQLEVCLTDHKACSSPVATLETPLRLLCLEEIRSGGSGLVKLVDKHSMSSARPDFVSLSYCWGVGQTLVLSEETLPDLTAGMQLSLLPLNFRQIMPFIRRLGFQYVWIDALCIRQDSDMEKASEIAKMRSYYHGSALTIALTEASSVDSGVFGVINSSQHSRETLIKMPGQSIYQGYRIRPKGPDRGHMRMSIAVATQGYNHLHSDYALFQRGWAHQERMLSRRILYVCNTELIWQCSACWYCQCAMGIADHFSLRLGSYKVGMWQDWLHASVYWKSSENTRGFLRHPSWSWCSWIDGDGSSIAYPKNYIFKDPDDNHSGTQWWFAPRLKIVDLPDRILAANPWIRGLDWLTDSLLALEITSMLKDVPTNDSGRTTWSQSLPIKHWDKGICDSLDAKIDTKGLKLYIVPVIVVDTGVNGLWVQGLVLKKQGDVYTRFGRYQNGCMKSNMAEWAKWLSKGKLGSSMETFYVI